MAFSTIGPIAVHLPERVETNAQIQAEYPAWDMDLISQKTGIAERRIADPRECASDLGVAAAERLFAEYQIDRDSIDFLLFCTQTPDYPLPTTACLMQQRLGLSTRIGAIDFNLGCSGFVYGLALADGLIRSGAARRVLLITAETYSRYIAPGDRSLRPIFGDGAAATLVEACETPALSSFVFGTDGDGADTLLVCGQGARPVADAIKPRKKQRWPSPLFMDGPSLVAITVERVPILVDQLLQASGWRSADVDLYLMHQATWHMLDHLRERLGLTWDRLPIALERYGNTVSSTIPILIRDLRAAGRLPVGTRSLLIGFGVGFSWAGCCWTETFAGQPSQGCQDAATASAS